MGPETSGFVHLGLVSDRIYILVYFLSMSELLLSFADLCPLQTMFCGTLGYMGNGYLLSVVGAHGMVNDNNKFNNDLNGFHNCSCASTSFSLRMLDVIMIFFQPHKPDAFIFLRFINRCH